MAKPELDPRKLAAKQALLRLVTFGAYAATMISLGCRLDLYASLARAGSATPAELARRTGLHERWLREWLRAQAAAGVIEYASGRFSISPEAASLLADAESADFAGGRMLSMPAHISNLERLPAAFRSGIGYTWDDRGRAATEATERARGAWYERDLVANILPKLERLAAKLAAGATVADVGCGTGRALIQLAKAYPRSRFHGYEISADALEVAAHHRREAGLANVIFHNAETEPLPDQPTFDLVLTFDCLHDMTDPAAMAVMIRRAIAADGTWLILEIDAAPTFEENLARNREQAATSYAISVLSCLASSMAAPGAVGYGTLGLPEPVLREIVTAAGFRRCRRLDLPAPLFNVLYEAKP
jgi:SAM-dependent methyltransferase